MQVERFKELELERYKLLERDRVNKDFNKKLSDYETEYRQRLDGLHRREVESARAIDKLVSASCILTKQVSAGFFTLCPYNITTH